MALILDFKKAREDILPLDKWRGKNEKERMEAAALFWREYDLWTEVLPKKAGKDEVESFDELEKAAAIFARHSLTKDLGIEALRRIKRDRSRYVFVEGKVGSPKSVESLFKIIAWDALLRCYTVLKAGERILFIKKFMERNYRHYFTGDAIRKRLKRAKHLTLYFAIMALQVRNALAGKNYVGPSFDELKESLSWTLLAVLEDPDPKFKKVAEKEVDRIRRKR